MQIWMEDARIGHVPMVEETHGIEFGEQQSRTVDAIQQSHFADGAGLQEQPIAFSQQRRQP